MLKKTLIVSALILTVLPAAEAAGPARKFYRGAVNIVTAPMEIPKQTRIYWKRGAAKTDHILVWIFCGAVKGTVNTVARVGSGVWDVATFPLDVPQDRAPLMEPEFVFEDKTASP